jgi:hypothetical protein
MIGDVYLILWKEYRDFRRQFPGHITLFAFFACGAGILAPHSFLNSTASSGPPAQVLDWVMLLSAFVYAGFVSELSFFEERANGTLQTLLTTRLWPLAVFFGKWLWMMAQAAAMILSVYVCQRLVEVGHGLAGKPLPPLTLGNVAWSALVAFFALCLCSFLIAANATISLVVPNSRIGRLVGGFFCFTPLLGAFAFQKLFAVAWDQTMIWLVGGLCVVLSIIAFLSACLAFRFERIRR